MKHHRLPASSSPRCLPCILAAMVVCASPALRAGPAPDMATVPADLRIPELTDGPPGPGKRVRFKLFASTPPVILYLPTDWSPERKFPVIVELAGNGNYKNAFGDISTGLPEGSSLGYGLSEGRGCVWACLPFLNHAGDAVATTWWGNAPDYQPASTVAFLKRAVPALCDQFSGDPGRVILCGFSRGSIAANAIGLHDDGIAGLWRAFVCYSHYDGVREGWPFAESDRPAARKRLARLAARPQLICHESVTGELNLEASRRYLDQSGITGDFTFLETGFRNHNGAWVLRPSAARTAAREWLSRILLEPAGNHSALPVGFVWPSAVPADCPFPRSPTLNGIHFTGRHSDYHCGDTIYPTWAGDGNLYTPWTDGKTDGVTSGSGDKLERPATTGHAVMTGDDPLRLTIKNTSPPKEAWAKPYKGRYPCGSLVYDGIWYYGTYCLGPSAEPIHEGFKWNWPNLGPMPGFQISRDLGKTWEPSPLSPAKPLFPEPGKFLGPVKMGAPHFVDFGRNMEHSPDGKAYLLGMGAEENDAKPRPCIKPGKPGEVFQVVDNCTSDFAHANLSWITADQAYLARVTPSPETINDLKSYEFFAGHDAAGKPVWTKDFAKIKPLLEWNNHMGCVTATYVPGLKKYLMCVTDGWPTVAKMNSYILEADQITGPWRMVTYMKDFGEQAYFLNFPSKFISEDGKTLWLCYSANFSPGWNGVDLKFNPPGGRYGLSLHEIQLLEP